MDVSHTHNHFQPHTDPHATSRRLAVALLVTLAFVVFEAGTGLWANSLALVTDSLHNLSDALALGLSWWALRLSLRPATGTRTFGYHRAGILAALGNGAGLIGLALIIAFEALQRIGAPPEVNSQAMVAVGVVGFAVNAGIALSLMGDSRDDLNVRSAFLHMAGDALSIVGVVLAGIGIALLGWQWLDAAASLVLSALILWSALGILRETVDILLEGTPRGLNVNAMLDDMRRVPGVRGVHDLHVWSIASNLRMLSAHVLTDNMSIADGALVQQEINDRLLNDYGISHTALQLECEGCDPDVLYCDLQQAPARETSAEGK